MLYNVKMAFMFPPKAVAYASKYAMALSARSFGDRAKAKASPLRPGWLHTPYSQRENRL